MYLNFTALVYIAVAYLIRSIGVKKLLGTLKSECVTTGPVHVYTEQIGGHVKLTMELVNL